MPIRPRKRPRQRNPTMIMTMMITTTRTTTTRMTRIEKTKLKKTEPRGKVKRTHRPKANMAWLPMRKTTTEKHQPKRWKKTRTAK
jgi:hypothetical protein